MKKNIVRKMLVIGVFVFFLGVIILPTGNGMFNADAKDVFECRDCINSHTITMSYSFDEPFISEKKLDRSYHSIKMSGLSNHAKPGAPVLPIKSVNILLPYGCKEADYYIEVQVGEKIEINRENLVIEPGQRYYIDNSKTSALTTQPDHDIYSSNDPFPGRLWTDSGIQSFRGYTILTLQLHPVQYIPNSGQLFYYDTFDVMIKTEPSTVSIENYRGLLKDKERILEIVENPEEVCTYSNIPVNDVPIYEYVIITTNDYYEAFQKLATWKESRGMNTPYNNLNVAVVLLQDIVYNSSFWWNGYWGDNSSEQMFNDTQCMIRNFLKMAYTNWSTEYVLLGGDADEPIIPHRGMYVYDYDCGGHYTDYDIPCDMYYGCLDGNWNDNENDMWGEKPEADLLAELYIGRAPVDSLEEAYNFVNKTIAYENATAHDKTYLQTALMIGSRSDEITERGNSKDAVTAIIPQYTVARTYLRDGTYNKIDILNHLQNGPHIVDYAGHSSNTIYTSPNSIHSYDISHLTNVDFSLVCSGGCYSASFDNRKSNGDYTADAVGEVFVVSEGGAFAYVGNSRYGWYEPGTIIGPNDRYGRALFQTLMDLSQENQTTNLGKALQLAKEDLLFEHHYIHLWTYYTLNLLGDPEVQIEMKRTVPLARFSMPIDSGSYKLFPSTYGDEVIIKGTACRGFDPGSTFDHFTIEYGEGMSPTTWSSKAITLINDGANEVVGGILAKVDPSQLNNGPYIFRLSVYDSKGIVSQDWNVVMIANASTVFNKNNGKTYCSIQTAVDDADKYDTIYIGSREYFEYVSIDKPVILIGKGKNKTIIDGCAIRSVIEIFANGTAISGVTAQNSGMLHSFSYAFSGINVLSDKNILLNNNLYINDYCGIYLDTASHNLIINNNVEDNDFYGIKLKDSSKNRLVGNYVTNQTYGIRLDGSDNNSIYKNNLVSNIAGLQLIRSNNNSIFENIACGNLHGGIRLFTFSCDNRISNNYINGNDEGMRFEYFSSNNTIFHNVFMNNEGGNAYDECVNMWDAGYPVGGNYWDDYNGTDEDGDGFGDSPYNITGGDNQDRYPFMKPNAWLQSISFNSVYNIILKPLNKQTFFF